MVGSQQDEPRLPPGVGEECHIRRALVVGHLATRPSGKGQGPNGIGRVVPMIVREEEHDRFTVDRPDHRITRQVPEAT